MGTADRLEAVVASVLRRAEAGEALGRPGPAAAWVARLDAAPPAPGRCLDDYVEVQVHGGVDLGRDVVRISGSERGVLTFGQCCMPIPGDPIIGVIRKGQALEVHVHDCPSIQRMRGERRRWVDVEWEQGSERLFDVTVRLMTQNARGVLARVASAIAEENSNIQHVRMDSEQVPYSMLQFTLQVTDRIHLAKVLKAVRRIPEVVRIVRSKGDAASG